LSAGVCVCSQLADVFAFQEDGTVQAITSDGVTAWTADVSQGCYWGPGSILPDFHGGLVFSATGGEKFRVTPSIGGNPGWDSSYGIIVAGDGYAYVPYAYRLYDAAPGYQSNHLRLLRVNSDGAHNDIDVFDWISEDNPDGPMMGDGAMITDADTGILLSWNAYYDLRARDVRGKMATITGASASVGNSPGGRLFVSVVPVVQAQDGSFVGTAFEGVTPWDEGTNHMIAFDASGGLRRSVPGYTPQIATADGGVIATSEDGSAATFDQDGNATGQMASLPTQSWRGNTYQKGSVVSVVARFIDMALTLWANAGGNPSGNSAAARPWYFKLVWENNCSEFPAPPCGFTLYPDNPQVNEAMAIDASSRSATIKSAALAALKNAFYRWPVTVNVSEGSPNTGDNQARVLDGISLSPTAGQNCGETSPFPGSHSSRVYYRASMEQAQWALPVVLTTPADVQNALNRSDLMKAIGTGIGNTAAHEIAHQFFLTGHGMDDSSTHTYNGQGCGGDTAPWAYGIGAIDWEAVTAQAWTSILKRGWHR
jgi:hypothetical protein